MILEVDQSRTGSGINAGKLIVAHIDGTISRSFLSLSRYLPVLPLSFPFVQGPSRKFLGPPTTAEVFRKPGYPLGVPEEIQTWFG